MNNNTQNILEGIISVEAALNGGYRQIIKVYIDKDKKEKRDRKITRLISLLKSQNIPFDLCDREFIDSITDGTTHGGVAATVSERKYSNLYELLSSLKCGEYAVFLDGVEDPFNFGYSIRNLFAFGCRGFIVPERNWMSSCNVVAKASAGASELCNMAISAEDEETVEFCKKAGVEIVCSALSGTSIPLYDFRLTNPSLIFIGGEKRGISKVFMEHATKVVHIPYSNQNAKYSLPTASCSAIFGSHLASRKSE